MKERPILFSGPMVRAIIEGCKTQTRRVIKPQPDSKWVEWCIQNNGGSNHYFSETGMHLNTERDWIDRDNGECPYGAIGDRLWVRETWCLADGTPNDGRPVGPDGCGCFYRATDHGVGGYPDETKPPTWRPSIFMPRWASRILLEVADVRIERVQDISEADAQAEGWDLSNVPEGHCYAGQHARWWFRTLWNSINADHGYGWVANPWVWVVGFKVV